MTPWDSCRCLNFTDVLMFSAAFQFVFSFPWLAESFLHQKRKTSELFILRLVSALLVSFLNRFQESDALIRKAAICFAFQSNSNLKSVCPAGRISYIYFLILKPSFSLKTVFYFDRIHGWPVISAQLHHDSSGQNLKTETFLTRLCLTHWCKTGFWRHTVQRKQPDPTCRNPNPPNGRRTRTGDPASLQAVFMKTDTKSVYLNDIWSSLLNNTVH